MLFCASCSTQEPPALRYSSCAKPFRFTARPCRQSNFESTPWQTLFSPGTESYDVFGGFDGFALYLLEKGVALNRLVIYEHARREDGRVIHRVRGIDAITQAQAERVNNSLEYMEAFNDPETDAGNDGDNESGDKDEARKDNNTQPLEYTTLIALTAVVAAMYVMLWKAPWLGERNAPNAGNTAHGDDGHGGNVDGSETDAGTDSDNANGDNDNDNGDSNNGDKDGEQLSSAMCRLTWEAPPRCEWGHLLPSGEDLQVTPDGVN